MIDFEAEEIFEDEESSSDESDLEDIVKLIGKEKIPMNGIVNYYEVTVQHSVARSKFQSEPLARKKMSHIRKKRATRKNIVVCSLLLSSASTKQKEKPICLRMPVFYSNFWIFEGKKLKVHIFTRAVDRNYQ